MKTAIRFRDVNPGDELPGFEKYIDQAFIDKYAVASLDLNPVHIDPDWAARAQVFGRPATVAHGMYTMSLMSAVVTRAWGATVPIMRMKSKFTKPVWVDQTVTLNGKVKEVHHLNPGRHYASVDVTAHDSEGDLVGFCEIQVRLAG